MCKFLKIKLLALLAASLPLIVSCGEENYDLEAMDSEGINIHTKMAAPICTSRSTFADIFDMESIKGILYPVSGKPIDLAASSLGEIQNLLGDKPLELLTKTKFNSSVVVDDIDFSEVFGEGNQITALDSIVFILDVETNVPFDISFKVDFVAGSNPSAASPAIESLHSEISVPACTGSQGKVQTSQYLRYGKVCESLSKATGLVMSLNFDIPKDSGNAFISLDQYVDLKMKVFVEGDFNASES